MSNETQHSVVLKCHKGFAEQGFWHQLLASREKCAFLCLCVCEVVQVVVLKALVVHFSSKVNLKEVKKSGGLLGDP